MEIKFSVMAIFILRREVIQLKIKKVDDKPMVIHTKQKVKIHKVESKKADEIKNNMSANGKPSIKKSVFAQYRQNLKDSKQSIKTKNSSIKLSGVTGANSALDQMEGGDEIKQAAMVAYSVSSPVTGTASKGARLFKNKVLQNKKQKIKKVDAGKKIAKKTVKKTAQKTVKKVAKDTAKTVAKETAKTTAKVTTKVATSVATTAAGTAVAPGVGTAIGIGVGYATGVAMDYQDMVMTNRSRKLKFFLDKMNAQDQQKDSFAKLVKDLIVSRVSMAIKTVAPILGLVFLLLVIIVAAVAIPVVAIVAVIYNSPLAIFFPPLEDGDTVKTVASAYVVEFNREVNTLANDHEGYDTGKVVYVGYDEGVTPSNYYDILCIYMVKYGVEDMAVIVNDTSRDRLQTIVNDMCSYTTSTGTETITYENGSSVTQTVLYVNVTLKTYLDMEDEYGFSEDQKELLHSMMSQDSIDLLNGG